MGDAARRLTDQAPALPEDAREAIALGRMASLGEREDERESAWASERDRRVAKLRSGAVALRPWGDAKTDLLARLPQK